MKQVQFLIALLVGMGVAIPKAQSQTSQQKLTFSIFGQYQTNRFTPNSAHTQTNEMEIINSMLISTATVVKAIAIDLAGPGWTNWSNASLVRETDLTSGVEGIFLISGTNSVNVSKFFGGSFSDDFTATVTNNFAGITNFNNLGCSNSLGFNGLVNYANLPITSGTLTMTETNTITNNLTATSLCYITVITTNLTFNLLGYGCDTDTTLTGSISTNRYSAPMQSLEASGVGTFTWNLGTNLLDTNIVTGTWFVSGPAHGSFGTSPPSFSKLPFTP